MLRAEPFGCPLFCACHRHRMSSYYSNWLLTFFVTCLPGRCLVILRQGFDLKCFRFSFLYCFTFWNPTASAAPLRSWYDQNWFMKSKGRSGWGCATPTDKDLTSSKFLQGTVKGRMLESRHGTRFDSWCWDFAIDTDIGLLSPSLADS